MTENHKKPGSAGTSATRRHTPAGPAPFSATELRQISTHITTQWFLPVEGSRLTLMEIDPWRVHAYWNVAEADAAAARASLPAAGRDAVLVLRFTDLTPGTSDLAPPHPRFDVEVQQLRNNWYIGLWRDAKHYSAEIGLRAPDGTFVGLVRSNEVVTPRAGPSPEVDFRHLEVRPPRTLEVRPMVSGTSPADDLLRDLFPKRLPPVDEYPFVVADASRVFVEEPPFPSLAAQEDVGPADVSWDGAAADETADALRAEAAGSAEEFPTIPAAEIEPYRALARGERARVLARIGVPLPPVADETVAPVVDLEPQPLPIPLARPAAVAESGGYSLGSTEGGGGGASVWQAAVPLEAVLAAVVSSPGQSIWPVQALVDLVVHGRSTSATPLTLCGEPVPVHDDGTFTLRLPVDTGPELAELVRRLCGRYADKDDR
jgi:hypothetical protein